MLTHFPTALFPFALATDTAAWFNSDVTGEPGIYAQAAGLGIDALAMIYGVVDFLQLDPRSKAWRIAGIHGLLQLLWLCCFGVLLLLWLKDGHVSVTHLCVSALAVIGMLASNYLGAELIIRYHVGINGRSENDANSKAGGDGK